MDTAKAQSLIDQLEDNIDDLDETLLPIIRQALSESTKKLPLLDRAKLHIVIVYAIESLLFSYLKLHNVDAKEHPVFRELTRVKQYFEKVKSAEEGPVQPRENLSLNKQAAARIIKHSLAGNDNLDLARLEREAREKIIAKRKLKDLETSMKEKAQASEEESRTVEEQLVDQIAADIEQQQKEEEEEKASVAIRSTEATRIATEATPKSSKKEKKRKRRDNDTANGLKAHPQPQEPKAFKRARTRAKKESQAATETTG